MIYDYCRFLFRFLTVNSYKKDPKTSRFFFIHTSISLIIEVKNVAIGSKISFFKSIFKTIQSLARNKHITAKNNISPELVKFSRALVARSSPETPNFFFANLAYFNKPYIHIQRSKNYNGIAVE